MGDFSKFYIDNRMIIYNLYTRFNDNGKVNTHWTSLENALCEMDSDHRKLEETKSNDYEMIIVMPAIGVELDGGDIEELLEPIDIFLSSTMTKAKVYIVENDYSI